MQKIFEGAAIAIDSLRGNRARAGLTILGIAIGVTVVMVMSSMVRGINRGVVDIVEQLGPRTFYVFKFFQNGVITRRADLRRNPDLTEAEGERIAALPSIDLLVYEYQTQLGVEHDDVDLPGVGVIGRGAGWLRVYGGDIYPGRSFTPLEDRSHARVAVVNRAMAEELFGRQSPLGARIKVAGVPHRVVGVYNPPPDIFGSGNSPAAIVPYGTFRKYLPTRNDDFGMAFTVRPADGLTVQEAIDDVTMAIRTTRGLRPGVENNFAVVTQDRLLDNFNRVTGMFFVVMLALSSVALLVGGVGVVAVMMISVTERTREIGVRKALGARRREILWQFLVEAATLTVIGGACGVVAGGTLAFLVKHLSPLPAEVPIWSVVAALAAAVLTGVGFGIVPAARAARLNPVEALRYE